MTAWGAQRLPIRFDPSPGEGLDSWLEAYARRLTTSSRDLLDHLGLTNSTLAHMVTTLSHHEREILSAATGLAPTVLTGLTLAPFDGVAVTIDAATGSTGHPPTWRRQTGSRFCPACLGENNGRWQLRWRLPWTFACTIHSSLLIDHCPACGKRPAPHRRAIHTPATGASLCTAPRLTPGSWQKPECGHPLPDIPALRLPAGGTVITAQHQIDHLQSAAAASTDPHQRRQICRALSDLHTLAYKSLAALHQHHTEVPASVHTVIAECGADVPAQRGALDSHDAHTIAVTTAIAVTAHGDDAAGQTILSWIITADRQRLHPAEPNKVLQPWTNADPALTARILTILDPDMQVRDRLTYASASSRPRLPRLSQDHIRRRAAALPSLLWPTWAIRLIPTSTTAHSAAVACQAALTVMILIPGTRLSTQQAIDLLGSPTTSRSGKTALPQLNTEQRAATIAILTDLAHTLDTDTALIDYTRRRALFSHSTTDRNAYARLTAAHDWHPPSPLQRRILNDHLTALLTGAPPRQSTTPGRRAGAHAWNPLTLALPPSVRDFVHGQAQQLLDQHQINEPLTWHPDPPPAAPWPGINPDSVDADTYAHAFTTHATDRCGLRRIREATHLTGVQVQLYAQINGQHLPDQRWNDLAATSPGEILNPADLQHLYHDQQMSMNDIARHSLTTERVVRDTLTTAGTELLSRRPRTTPVTPEWFQQHYLNTGKSITQAAAEAGVSRNTFSKYAHRHHIPTGTNAAPANPFARWPSRRQPPPSVIAACSGPRGVEYVRHILQMQGHHTRRAASAALNLHEQVLCHQRQHVEQAAGIRIFQPGTPLTLTPEGVAFLRHAARALQRLNQERSGRP